ncbi:transposable element Tc3 transposase [Trichonephila clavipes]|uniref:Transposable element Tc3 transposase n=1 Tax=Trichonephila clavipes TaxID=2585209 RepID=A0A8X6SBP8_TRICX|nr:transposable element Tc3 transposase [Trichonephila clavipes]
MGQMHLVAFIVVPSGRNSLWKMPLKGGDDRFDALTFFLPGDSYGRWCRGEGFVKTGSAGGYHLRFVSRGSRVNSHSNEEMIVLLIVYGAAKIVISPVERFPHRHIPHELCNETGGKFPEAGIFSIFLYLSSTIGMSTMLVRFLIVDELNRGIDRTIDILNKITVVIGFIALIGMVIVAAYPFGLAIHQNDHQARHRFVEWSQNEIAVIPDFHNRILLSDEAHFWFNGYVNKQNSRIWSEANPQVYVETPLHPEKLTVWCALWAGGIIGPYFFKKDEGHNVTVNGDRYRAMITNFFIPELNNHDVQELWFQQDGATCHTARATIDLLKDTLGDRLISHFGPVNWPPRSCDLTPLDYFLWGYVNSLVYADKPQTLDHLKDNIRLFFPIYGHKRWK